MLLSIIVPFYNTEKYLQKTLKSIQNQTLTDFECLMIDDGSTDNSVGIAQSFAKSDNRFKLFSNCHVGLASVLNLALSHVNGNYITFCDSDDFLEPDAYQHLIPLIDQTPDLIISNLYFEKCNHPAYNSNYRFHNLLSIEEIINTFPLMYRQQMMYYNTNKIYRRELVNNLHFHNLTVGLDTIFNYQVFSRCQTILFNQHPYYHYLQRKGSLVNHFDSQRLTIREKETAALKTLLHNWHAAYTDQLLNEEWFNTLANVIANIYAPLQNGQAMELSERLHFLNLYLNTCLEKIDSNLITPDQLSFIHQIKKCVDNHNDEILYKKYSIS